MICRICGNEEDNQSYEVQEMMIGYNDVFRYFQCAKCNCLQITEFPPDMSKYYPDSYYSLQPILKRDRITKLLLHWRDKCALYETGIIGKLLYARYPYPALRGLSFVAFTKAATILDVGCGTGYLLYRLRELGYKNVLGVDPFVKKDIEYKNGVRILRKTIHDVDGDWDMVMFHHSFEHLPDPRETLRTVSDLLKPDGVCIIAMPIVSSYAWEHYGVKWVQIEAPRHFFLHSVESLGILAKEAALDVYNIIYNSTSCQFWGSEQCKKNIPLSDRRSYLVSPRKSIFSKKEIAYYARRAKELNDMQRGDQAIFYLRKLRNIPA